MPDAADGAAAKEVELANEIQRTRARLSAAEKGEWAMLYCGSAQVMRIELQAIARSWGVQFSEESFSW